MKNFDFPYINDSPVDLSGREGAPRDLSGIHDGNTCNCEMCLWANKQEREMLREESVCKDIDEVLIGLSPFAAAWASAPESMKRYVEENDARYWFMCGQQASERDVLKDLQEMNRLMREKGLA